MCVVWLNKSRAQTHMKAFHSCVRIYYEVRVLKLKRLKHCINTTPKLNLPLFLLIFVECVFTSFFLCGRLFIFARFVWTCTFWLVKCYGTIQTLFFHFYFSLPLNSSIMIRPCINTTNWWQISFFFVFSMQNWKKTNSSKRIVEWNFLYNTIWKLLWHCVLLRFHIAFYPKKKKWEKKSLLCAHITSTNI